MTMRITDAVRNDLADSFATAVDAGVSDSEIQLRSGSRPASITDPAAGTLLATVTLPATTFGAASGGTITANSISAVTGAATGDIGHFRVLDGDGTVVEDSDSVGTSGTELEVNTVTVTSGESVEITAWTVTMPAE